ncbi:MAG TPA: peptidoglycan DD-metalloendopeptidase family protein [Alphaproteobacteria bacterium]|nr:peptidoglycan DD-metalloendopeptidase family protein [Alphaproteobacteria bacterium]USO05216.1 MAG: peptidoglycan DD-metalloendopeptidase family protein [Rhodospirillales bacterium]HOO81015.1 peptidoglycan DD-metalloendopeptidase family protein [Alphaproteobacteria bacterium]
MQKLLIICAILASTLSSAKAQNTPKFSFPLDCTLGTDCWIANYVDVDPTEGVKDFKCTAKTYDGHKGVDFALKSRVIMNKGVNVLAAADGTILRMRDSENDNPKTKQEYDAITAANKDCGNGVILDHGQGLQTFYCHLKNGSIKAAPGQKINAGETLGQVGQSGFAEFPHLHFTVIWEGSHIDPFTGMTKEDGCGKFKQSLWNKEIPYAPYALFNGGFAENVPDFKTLNETGTRPQEPTLTSKAFVFWISLYQMQKGDQITLKVLDPDGKTFIHREITQDTNRARQHYYTGRKLKDHSLKPGTYTATATLKTEGYETYTQDFKTTIK